MNKRMANRWALSGSFSWNADHLSYSVSPQNPLQAYNTREATTFWFSSFRGSYQAKYGIVISPVLRILQGQPTDRLLPLIGFERRHATP